MPAAATPGVRIEYEKSPPDTPAGVHVSDKCGIDEAFPRANVGNVSHPQFFLVPVL